MMDSRIGLYLPAGYSSLLSIRETEIAIKNVKDFFETALAEELNLTRVSAPLFVLPESGLNDNLSGVERPVSFDVLNIKKNVEIVQSLAKWKRLALKKYSFAAGEGLYTDMNAIRRDDSIDNLHSIYVDQWDWEVIIDREQRSIDTLQLFVNKIFFALKKTEEHMCKKFTVLKKYLPEAIKFITSQELLDLYPLMDSKQRENEITRLHGAVCLTKIGGELSNGEPHDNRAPDYDDWSMNCDILIWSDVLNCAVEISSMGVRVDADALRKQIELRNCPERLEFDFHKKLLNDELPFTIGGGIGQSRICMLYLQKAHVGEVQASVWSDEMIAQCTENGIMLL